MQALFSVSRLIRLHLGIIRRLSSDSFCARDGPPGFVFDIDGVLVRGRAVLPMARQAMSRLCCRGEWSVPVVFLTNGGGVLESTKARQLSEMLNVPVSPDQACRHECIFMCDLKMLKTKKLSKTRITKPYKPVHNNFS